MTPENNSEKIDWTHGTTKPNTVQAGYTNGSVYIFNMTFMMSLEDQYIYQDTMRVDVVVNSPQWSPLPPGLRSKS